MTYSWAGNENRLEAEVASGSVSLELVPKKTHMNGIDLTM